MLTYCVIENYFHLMVCVPEREAWMVRFEGVGGEARLLDRLLQFYSTTFVH